MNPLKRLHSSNATQTTESIKSRAPPLTDRNSRAVWIGRAIFLLCLGLTAAALGLGTFRMLIESEDDLAESQFEAIADRPLDAAFQISARKRLGTITIATIAANANPDADTWPFVTMMGYEKVTTNLIETSSGREMGFAPLVTPEELSMFEDFAYDYYFNIREPPFPNYTAISSFGKGVWGTNPNENSTDNRYHETDGSTSYGSPNRIFAPILQHNAGPHKALMLNLHFQETRGVIIDNMMQCAKTRNSTGDLTMECGAITDFLILTSQEFHPGPGALIMQPIYPARSPFELKGLLASSIIWDEVLTDVFSASVNGVDCMLRTPGGVYTYHITNGHVDLKGEGDLREKGSIDYCRSTYLMREGFYSKDSVSYELHICPSADFFDTYSTKNPLIATVGSVCIIVFSVLVFFCYDRCVRKEFDATQGLLEAKRKFVRFVSHEVRTPLNSVCMGLTLLQDEMTKALKDKSGSVEMQGEQAAPESKEGGSIVEWHDLIDDVLENAKVSVDVLNDLLQYDKIEMGAFNLELEILSPWKLVAKTVKEFQLAANKKNLKLVLDLGGETLDNPSIELSQMIAAADPFRLTQVIRNLVSNAIKFTPDEGEVKVHVLVKPLSEAGHAPEAIEKLTLHNGKVVRVQKSGRVKIEVSDTGAGLSTEQVAHMFRQGVQFDANKLQSGGGSGLGLYIAKGIAEQHKGALTVRSPGLGLGTTFILKLPLYHVLNDDNNEYNFAAQNIDRESITKPNDDEDLRPAEPLKLRILVVDDSATNRRLLLRYLHRNGHICDEAADGVEAVERVTQSMESGDLYNCILMDFEMPRLSGPKATRAIRKAGCDSFIVGISGNVLPEDVAYFCEHGANAVLPKPVQFGDLETLWYEYGFPDRMEESSRYESN